MSFVAPALPYIMAAGTALSAFSAIQQGNAMASAERYNASIEEQNAANARAVAATQESDIKYKAGLQLGAEKAIAAASGADPNEGSPLQLMTDTAQQTTLDALRAKYQGDVGATNFLNQAQLDRYNAAQDQRSGLLKAGASILNGATSYALYSSRYGAGGGTSGMGPYVA